MRKYQIYLNIILLIVFSNTYAQQLSSAGHIVNTESKQLNYQLKKVNNDFEVFYQNKNFKGNTLYETGSGFMSVSANYENAPADLYFYNSDGSFYYHKQFPQSINIRFSEKRDYVAFYSNGFIHSIHIPSKSENIVQGSTLFSINDRGEVTQLNKNRNVIYVDGISVEAPETIYRIINHNNLWYYVSRASIYKYENNVLQNIYTTINAVLFDVEVYGEHWYISNRTKTNSEYNFTLLKTTDFNSIQQIETKKYERVFNDNSKEEKIHPKFQNRNNELIKNPMDFFSTDSYQEIGNTYNEIQEYSPGSTYLHPGVDLFGEHLENVHSVKKGFVKAILTTSGDYHWRVAISNKNSSDSTQGYLYAHLDQNLIPVLEGDSVEEGEVIGQLVDFPVTGFVHCHFARIVDEGFLWTGSWWTFDDPLYYMSNFRDTTAPVFEEATTGQKFAFRDIHGDYLSSDNVYGEVDIISKVYDQINTFWKVDVHKIGYKIKEWPISMPIITNEYSFDFNMFNDTYFSGPYIQDIINTMYSRDVTCFSTGNYNERAYYHILTNSNGDDTITSIDANLIFDTKLLPNDDYLLEVWAIDAAGNESVDSMVFTINNFVGIDESSMQRINIYPNPADNFIKIETQNSKLIEFVIYDALGSIVSKGNSDDGIVDVVKLKAGIYFIKTESGIGRFLKF